MSYGQDKGRRDHEPVKRSEPPPLTEEAKARIARMKARFEQHFPDDDITRRLYEAGLIDGWRNLESVTELEDDDGTD